MNRLPHLLVRTSQAALLSVMLAASASAQTPPAAPVAPSATDAAPAPVAPPPAAAAPAPAPVAPPPAAAAPAPAPAAPPPAAAAPAPAPAAPPPAAAAPAPAPAAPPPAAAAPPAAQTPTKIDELAILYVVAATAQLCELDLSDSEDEKLQKAVDAAEEAAGLKDEARDAMWNKVVADINRDTKKACADYSTEAMGMIRALKD